MAKIQTAEDIIKILEASVNFMTITLLGETLSPSTDMERQDTIARLNSVIEKLNQIKDTGFQKLIPVVQQKVPKKEKKNEKPPISENLVHSLDEKRTKKQNVQDSSKCEEPCTENIYDDTIDSKNDFVDNVSVAGSDHSNQTQTDQTEHIQQMIQGLSKCSMLELKDKAVYFGFLLKHKNRTFTKWHKRFCILVDELLFYFKSDTDVKEKGFIIISEYSIGVPKDSKGFSFHLDAVDKNKDSYIFQADHKNEYDLWMKHISDILNKRNSQQELGIVNQASLESEEIYNDVADNHDGMPNGIPNDGVPVQEEIYNDVVDNFTPPSVGLTQRPSIRSPVSPSGDDIKMIPSRPAGFNEPLPPPYIPARNESPNPSPARTPVIPERPPSANFLIQNIFVSVYDCQGDDKDDLSFKRGEIVYKLHEEDMNWWVCYFNGKVGLAPSNYLTEAFN